MFTRHVSRMLLQRTKGLSQNASMTRCFGAAARKTNAACVEPTTESADLIRDYIKGLMEKKQSDEVILKPITDDELQQRLDSFQVSTSSIVHNGTPPPPPPTSFLSSLLVTFSCRPKGFRRNVIYQLCTHSSLFPSCPYRNFLMKQT